MAMAPLILALDFGGTKHTAGLFDLAGPKWLRRNRVFSPPGADANYDRNAMLSLANQLLQGQKPSAIGVSFGGPVDALSGCVRLSHHVHGWEGIPLADLLQTEYGCIASVDNDANVAALGEYNFGAGKGLTSLLYITVSTGVGGGWVLDGKVWRGADGMAGEIGHMVVDPQGPVCLCGKRGCVERLASGPYMAQDAREALFNNASNGEILRKLCNEDLSRITGEMVSQAAASGDTIALKVLERGTWGLGVAIGNAANLMNPQRIILGGGVTKSGVLFWDGVRRAARITALPQINIDIIPAALGDDAPLWGAAALGIAALDWKNSS